MVFCDEKGCFGGDEDVELKDPWRNGLLERFEGLVLLGLGPPAMIPFVQPFIFVVFGETKRREATRSRRWNRGKSTDDQRARLGSECVYVVQ